MRAKAGWCARAFSSTSKLPDPVLYDRHGKALQTQETTDENRGTIAIDRSGLLSFGEETRFTRDETGQTELLKFLKRNIEMRGAISISEFMRIALLHPQLGYYCRTDVFGQDGDFTTSPEISQMFGELLGVWCVSNWMALGEPSSLSLVELGPGRGTLMADILRVAHRFPNFRNALCVNFVERSPVLREYQAAAICCQVEAEADRMGQREATLIGQIPSSTGTAGAIDVAWYEELNLVPKGTPTLMLAQEFFDALPVHQFQLTEKGWCERLVDVDEKEDSKHHLRFVLSPAPTVASRVLLGKGLTRNTTDQQDRDRVRRDNTPPDAKVGDAIEISPAGIGVCQDMAQRIADDGGAALIIDYGHDHAMADSIRGIKQHTFVDIFEDPGMVDLSIDVDFSALRRAVDTVSGAAATPVITQGSFLRNMGIDVRMAKLLESASEESAERLFSEYERLTGDEDMGRIYKVMGIVTKDTMDMVGCEGFTGPQEKR